MFASPPPPEHSSRRLFHEVHLVDRVDSEGHSVENLTVHMPQNTNSSEAWRHALSSGKETFRAIFLPALINLATTSASQNDESCLILLSWAELFNKVWVRADRLRQAKLLTETYCPPWQQAEVDCENVSKQPSPPEASANGREQPNTRRLFMPLSVQQLQARGSHWDMQFPKSFRRKLFSRLSSGSHLGTPLPSVDLWKLRNS